MATKKVQKNITPKTYRTIVRPRITEKGTDVMQKHNAYLFNVEIDATKGEIAHAVEVLYGVTPLKVRTVPVKSKEVFVRGKYGSTARGKKAYVYLKKGDTIAFV